MNHELHPHQHRALDLLRQSLGLGNRRPMLMAPTGFGKTLLAAAVVEGALRKGNRVIFTVPALTLVDQTVEAFWEEGITDIGVMQAKHTLTDETAPVQVASVQTLQRRRIPPAAMVIVDEAHRWFDFYGRWMSNPAWQDVPFIGLSATPWTRGLSKHYDDLIVAATTADLIRDGYLSAFRVYAPSHPDLTAVRTVAGDYHEGDLSGAMDRPELVADIVTTWRQKGEGRPTLCFAVDRAHAKRLEGQFRDAGISAGYMDAFTPIAEREVIRAKFRAGRIQVVCNVGVLTTGVDWDVRCIILARPTKSEILFVQIIGRGLRPALGKADCLILDHSDTHLRLGFVTDIHHGKLDDGKPRSGSEPRERISLPIECPSCSYLKPPKVHRCPSCGFGPERQSAIEPVEGELVELAPRRSKPSAVEKQHWYSMLLSIAESRGYRRGWAANQYRDKFGVWPRGLAEVTAAPDEEVERYVKSRMIRYAKRTKAAA